jgi:hypothetical protein
LALQIEPELRAVTEVAAEPHRRIGRDAATRRMSVMRPEGTPISSASRLALSLRATISRFNKRPGCTTGAMISTSVVIDNFNFVGIAFSEFETDTATDQSQPGSSVNGRPGERRDPYAAAALVSSEARLLSSN